MRGETIISGKKRLDAKRVTQFYSHSFHLSHPAVINCADDRFGKLSGIKCRYFIPSPEETG